ncbi:putative quinol monooxygenase [Solicola sp. PLA-1-18]|uniref:putative quinol monooxygenase n=1 Tax=Solicola sp. PLA-1-18 TaxID=3380532 RepID=UPI003B810A09
MSIQVVAVITAKPGSADEVRTALQSLVEPTRAEEGCLAYTLSESTAAPGTFVTVEEWSAESDLGTHLQTSHVQDALAAADGHLAEPPAIHPLRPVD